MSYKREELKIRRVVNFDGEPEFCLNFEGGEGSCGAMLPLARSRDLEKLKIAIEFLVGEDPCP